MYKQLSPQQIKELQKIKNLVIADVRDDASYQKGHIEDAIHLTMGKLQEFCDKTSKSQAIVVYCYHGISSQSVAQHLVEQGFTEVYSLTGGYEAWTSRHSTRK